MSDNDIITFGTHKGKKMIEVPDTWLLWLWGENKDVYLKNSPNISENCKRVMDYIRDSFEESKL